MKNWLLTAILSIYLLLYLLSWAFGLDSTLLVTLFRFLHILILGGGLAYLIRARPQLKPLLFWVFLFLLFLIPGAYLEYPSDPWEHFRRIFSWQAGGAISQYADDIKNKFFYFWSYSLIGWLPIPNRRIGLDILSALTQILVCFSLFRLLLVLNLSKAVARLCILGFIFLFGTNVFGLRYYALSSTPFAYVAYLEALTVFIEALKRKNFQYISILIPITLFIYFNHKQELIFLSLSLFVITFYFLYFWLSKEGKKKARRSLYILFFIGMVSGYLLMHLLPEWSQKMLPGQITYFGSFNLWLYKKFYLETIGVYGLLGILFAVVFFRRHSLLFLISLAPIFSLLFPPSALLISKVLPDGYLTYRILYAFPLAVAFVVGSLELLEVVGKKLNLSSNFRLCFCVLIIFSFSYPIAYPWRGKLRFQLDPGSKNLSLGYLDETAEWFTAEREIEHWRNCWFISDPITKTALSAHLGIPDLFYGGESTRRARIVESRDFPNTPGILDYALSKSPFCGVLVVDKDNIENPQSFWGIESGHWKAEWADFDRLVSSQFREAAVGLQSQGWTKTRVPPFYSLYEPTIDRNK